jgi:hypothetical protein
VNDKNYLNASFIPNICGGLVLHQVQLSCVHLNNADLVSPKPVPVLQSSFDLSMRASDLLKQSFLIGELHYQEVSY